MPDERLHGALHECAQWGPDGVGDSLLLTSETKTRKCSVACPRVTWCCSHLESSPAARACRHCHRPCLRPALGAGPRCQVGALVHPGGGLSLVAGGPRRGRVDGRRQGRKRSSCRNEAPGRAFRVIRVPSVRHALACVAKRSIRSLHFSLGSIVRRSSVGCWADSDPYPRARLLVSAAPGSARGVTATTPEPCPSSHLELATRGVGFKLTRVHHGQCHTGAGQCLGASACASECISVCLHVSLRLRVSAGPFSVRLARPSTVCLTR